MRETYYIPYNRPLVQSSGDVHDDILMLLKHRNPKADLFEEDPELEQLYLALMLIRTSHLRLWEEREEGDYIVLEVR